MKPVSMLAVLALTSVIACGSSPSILPGGGGGGGSGGAAVSPFPNFDAQLNSARAGPALNPLAFNTKLHAAAQGHADDMSAQNYFSHTSLDGRTLGDRIYAQGYRYCWAGENIAAGQATEAETFAAWMASPGHRANMLSAEPTQFALALAPVGNYRVLVLARPGC